jgi:hypothetical protein
MSDTATMQTAAELFVDSRESVPHLSPSVPPVSLSKECPKCGEWFTPRAGTGGSRQKYCSEPCRRAADSERKASKPQREQRAAQRAENPAPAPEPHPVAPEAAETEAESDYCWIVPPQDKIEVWTPDKETIRLEQPCPMGGDGDRIDVHKASAVRLARAILFAAGFPRVTIATRVRGGFVDLNDGDEVRNFDFDFDFDS